MNPEAPIPSQDPQVERARRIMREVETFYHSLPDENLQRAFRESLLKKDFNFAGELLEQIPKALSESLRQQIQRLRKTPFLLAMFLENMTDEEFELYADSLPDIPDKNNPSQP